ncbi:DUF4831 family protein [Aquimarina sp. Aq78]|uniref:DUF4831 family protein n=1 Tax=Aquimarina sp. Aq78 TaxID=1191889 RepID=UPI000D10131D|nr:DUF4831 family protein [Aquimarina sp. Aq78]
MKHKCLIIINFIFLFGCSSIQTVSLSDSKNSNDGFYYTLPRQNLIVSFDIKKTTLSKGKYSDFAESCLGLKPDKEFYNGKDPKIIYKVNSVAISPKTYLDNKHIYQLKVNQAFVNKTNFSLEYAKNGELTSAAQSIESQVIPFVVTVANTISSLSLSSLTLSSKDYNIQKGCTNEFAKNDIELLSSLQATTQEILEAETQMTNEQLDKRLEKIEGMKSSILSKFIGIKKIETKRLTFEITPEEFVGKEFITLFKIHKQLGLKREYPKNSNGKVLEDYIIFQSKSKSDENFKDVKIKVAVEDGVTKAIENHIFESKKEKKETNQSNENSVKTVPKGAFYYRIPSNTNILVKKENEIIKNINLPLPQLGTVVLAPDNLRKFSFKLYPGLGSIQIISAKTDSLSLKDIDSLRNTVFKNKEDKTIESLEKELKIKELRDKIEKVGTNNEEETESGNEG